MRLPPDELAGITDLFGGLTRAELAEAVEELAFRRGESFEETVHATAVENALDAYRLVQIDDPAATADPLLAAGPTAFPTVPDHGDDLPHILDVEHRDLDRQQVGEAAERRLRAEAAQAVDDGEIERIATLLDVTYDLEVWAPVDVASVRDHLDRATGED